jgi:hypothetical protein
MRVVYSIAWLQWRMARNPHERRAFPKAAVRASVAGAPRYAGPPRHPRISPGGVAFGASRGSCGLQNSGRKRPQWVINRIARSEPFLSAIFGESRPTRPPPMPPNPASALSGLSAGRKPRLRAGAGQGGCGRGHGGGDRMGYSRQIGASGHPCGGLKPGCL